MPSVNLVLTTIDDSEIDVRVIEDQIAKLFKESNRNIWIARAERSDKGFDELSDEIHDEAFFGIEPPPFETNRPPLKVVSIGGKLL
ncbi:MAG: hypothetical protein K6L81_02030 [Agarilytica sp.]